MPFGPGSQRQFADRAFSRTAGAPLVGGNDVRLLLDGRENYPAWLEAIAAARSTVHFECYIIQDDPTGRRFADALGERARAGVRVRLIYDWMGARGRTGRRFWKALREAGVEVRCFNPPRWDEPVGWLRRDHRKCLVADATVAFVTGLCVGKEWEGNPQAGVEPWRDTGVSIRGPGVRDVALAFADSWASMGAPVPDEDLPPEGTPGIAGEIPLRVVADTSGTAGAYRLDVLIAAIARSRLWLADAYYAGTPAYVQALSAAAKDGVDVRLLVPGEGSDIPVVQAYSRAGYRPLLEAGVRVFEWNGPMLHAKTAVADGRWSRVGSTNLNVASWMGNRELDVVVEHEGFGAGMETAYTADLARATEIVLARRRIRLAPGIEPPAERPRGRRGRASRAAASAVRIGNTLGGSLTQRILGPAEASLMAKAGLVLLLLVPVAILWPAVIAWPLAVLGLWFALALLVQAWRARR